MSRQNQAASARLAPTLFRLLAAPASFTILWMWLAPVYGLPGIGAIGLALVEMARNGTLFHDVRVSALRALGGFVLGFGAGASLGVLTGRYRGLFLLFGGLLLFLRWTPVLALVPLTIRVGGLGEGPKLFLIAWACLFVAWAYTHFAVAKMDRSYVWWSDSLGLTAWQRVTRVYAPAVSPALVGAARVALAIALIVVVAAEFGGTLDQGFWRDGLGYRISRAIETNRNDINVACILMFGVLGVSLDVALVQFVKRPLRRLTGMDLYRE